MRGILFGAVAAVSFAAPLTATADIVGVGKVKDWTVYQSTSGEMECGIISKPKESINTRNGKLAVVKRGDILLAVTIDPKLPKPHYLISFQSGYPFKQASTVTMRVDNTSFTLEVGKTEADAEWAWPAADDGRIVNAMKKGINAVLTAVSRRGTDTKDTFSLLGVTDALKLAEERCSVSS